MRKVLLSRLGAILVAAAPVSAAEVLDFSVTWSAPDRVAVPMKLRNGVPTIACLVNGREVWMILDTGSQRGVLEASTAAKAGVRLLGRAATVDVTGAHGKETAGVAVPESMAVGAWRWQSLPCVVRAPREKSGWFSGPEMAFDILGMDALQAMCSYVSLDYPRREVVFGFRQAFRAAESPPATQQPFVLRAGVPLVKIAHGGHEWTALVDTGASAKLEVNRATARTFGGRKKTRWIDAIHLGLGDSPSAARRRFETVVLPDVACLGRDWRNVEAMVVENESKIGSGLCLPLRLTIDFARSRLWLEGPAARAR